MKQKFLIALLSFSLLVELGLAIGAFFFAKQTLQLFGVAYTNETSFLGYIVAWFLLLVSILIAYIIYLVFSHQNYTALSNILALWWVGIGMGIYFAFGKMDNLLLDSLKGILLLALVNNVPKKKVTY